MTIEIPVGSVARDGIGGLVDAQISGRVTARDLTRLHLDRITALDRKGPTLNAVVTVAEEPERRAETLDMSRVEHGSVGALHGLPVVVGDCIETADMPTSFGSELFAEYRAADDASAVVALRFAGAIIIAKTALPDWASSWFGHSSRSGVTRNPYDAERDPGGAGAGTAAAVAAGYAVAGIGSDCAGSVRLPASFCNLVGVRPTPGMISRVGSLPIVPAQDTIGPMARTVEDAARLVDVLAGFDAADPLTAGYSIADHLAPGRVRSSLTPTGLIGRRLGVLRSAFGDDDLPDAAPVNEVMGDALRVLATSGAHLVDVAIGDLAGWLARTTLPATSSRRDLEVWLAARPDAPVRSVADILDIGPRDIDSARFGDLNAAPDHPRTVRAHRDALVARQELTNLLVGTMEIHDLAALVYPTCQVVPPRRIDIDAGRWDIPGLPTNTTISSQSGLPSMTVPAGPTAGRLPVGMEILVRPYAERTMFGMAYAFERARRHTSQSRRI